jgi:hypothetical protein
MLLMAVVDVRQVQRLLFGKRSGKQCALCGDNLCFSCRLKTLAAGESAAKVN